MNTKAINSESMPTTAYYSNDFIEEHFNTFFLLEETEEVIDDNEEASGPVFSVISGEVEDADEAKEVLDLLLYSDKELEQRVANYAELENPQTTGLAPDVIRLIPWTGFEMDDQGSGPESWSDFFGEWLGYLADAAELLKEGLVAIGNFIVDLGEAIVDWGMAVVGGIKDAFSAVKDAVSEVGELMSALADWIVSHVSSLFSSVWDTVISGLESWTEGIQEAMGDFFEELAEWDEMDGSESMEDTMEAGTALMLSFIGQQDRASSVMDVMERIMRFIEPFQEYLSPFGAIGILGEVFGESHFLENLKPYYDGFLNRAGYKIGEGIGWGLEQTLGPEGLLALLGIKDMIEPLIWDLPIVSFNATRNFLIETNLVDNPVILGVLEAISELDLEEMVDFIVNGVFAALTIFSLKSALFTADGRMALFTGALALILQSVSWALDNVAVAFTSFLLTLFDGFVGMATTGEKVSIIIGAVEFQLAFVPFFTWAATR